MTVAEQFDVTARLAEGRPTVEDVEEYVAACRRLGYQHRDLTAHPTQVRDWYDGDDGMNLSVLDADHSALSAAVSAAEEAARTQADLVAELTMAWAGRGAVAADEFLWRSSQAAQSVSTAVRRAADAAAALRDALWRAVDAKVAATEAVAARQAPHRVEWLAAARTVTNGGADVDAASELLHARVVPFVDLDVGSDWVSAMRAAAASIDAAYDAAVVALAAAPRAVFEVPGDVGPPVPAPPAHAGTPDDGGPVSTTTVSQFIPAAAVAPAASIPAAAAAPVGPAAAWADPPPAAAPAAPAAPVPPALPVPPLGDLGAGAQGSGLPGFGQQLADLLGGLIGSAGDGAPEDLALDDDPVDGEDREEDDDERDLDEEDADEEDADEQDGDEDPDEEDVDEPDADEGDPADCVEGDPPATAIPDAAPQPDSEAKPDSPPPAAPPLPPAPPPAAADGEPTPCEKAADAVPQVGE